MDLRLRGKRALVRGSTARIGLATAAGLNREGTSVVVKGRTKERVEEDVGKIRATGGDGKVANKIVYVCSPLASATNGAALRVDGGVVRAIV